MGLRILIGAGNYPKLSESYIEAEIQYLLRQGLEVAVWSDKVGSAEAPEIVPVFRRTVTEAVSKWKPDVFHAHYLTFAGYAFDQAAAEGLPCTVRGHSFDQGIERAKFLAARPEIRRIWLFPHFARLVTHPKVFSLPVAFDSSLYRRCPEKDRGLVYRTAAGKPGKGLEDFFTIADLCPGFRFELTANLVHGDEAYLPFLESSARKHRVSFAKNILRPEAVSRMNKAGIYLDTSDPKGHPFGMPISIAEALATGAYVLAREAPGLSEYLGDAGATYRTAAEAAKLIRDTKEWPDQTWTDIAGRAVMHAQLFSDEAVLMNEVLFWESLQSDRG